MTTVSEITKAINMMREDTAEFRGEFATLADDELKEALARQNDIAASAEFKAEAIQTELNLRTIRRALGPTSKEKV